MKYSDSPSTLRTYWDEPDQTNTDNITNYYDAPKYVVDVLGGAVSKTYRCLPESRNRRQDELMLRIKLVLLTYGKRTSSGFDVQLVQSALLCEGVVKQRA